MLDMLIDLIMPLLLCVIPMLAQREGIDVFQVMRAGAQKGLETVLQLLPALTILLMAVSMLRASGALEDLALWLSPVLERLGLPGELLPLFLLRPLSGSGAMAVGAEILESFGVDSEIGRMAAVLLGSTETTLYVLTVYFAGARCPKQALPAALCADLVGFVSAVYTVRWFFN